MLIDWFTVGAQALNFLILVYLLKRFLYGPIVKAMRERKERIEDSLAQARAERAAAESLSRRLEDDRAALDAAREALLAEARREVEQYRLEARDKARGEVEELRRAWEKHLADEQAAFEREFQTLVVDAAVDLSRRAVAELSGERFESALVETAVKKLRTYSLEDHPAAPEAVVRTGFALGPEQKAALAEALAGLGLEDEPLFQVDPALGPGVVVRLGDHRLEWSFARYFTELRETSLNALIPGGGGRQ